MKKLLYLGVTLLLFCCAKEQKIIVDISDDIIIPKNYVVHKTATLITIDGKADETDWKNAKFTDSFIDIEGIKTPKQNTKVKMLWDENYLYIYAKLEEKHIWADIKKRDEVIFYNNDFEVFIDPSNDTYNYGEIEINALNTVWDLKLDKPYRFSGNADNSWNLDKLKSAVFINGTLNNFSDEDNYWSLEIAIPLEPLVALKNQPKNKPINGEQWRINFSRVEWNFEIIDDKYARKKVNNKYLPEYNWVWSNQGAINMHIPENWGYLQFSNKKASEHEIFKPKTSIISEQITFALFRKINFGDLQFLKEKETGFKTKFTPITYKNTTLKAWFLKTDSGFTVTTDNKKEQKTYTIKEDGFIIRK